MSPQQQQDCSPDSSGSDAPMRVIKKPGLDTLDFDMSDCEDDIKLGPDLVQDCEPANRYISLSLYDNEKDSSCDEKKAHRITYDICDEDNEGNLRKGEKDGDNISDTTDDGWSTDENSGAEYSEEEDSDVDNDHEDYQIGKCDGAKPSEEVKY